ncbi:MAG TPA: nicotinate phosphoribosyltransferase [Bacteroidales bacterium]|jgi:nicotinate phosphoribosyltransferase|nr:nicotinate phosphoribosyltransferase [Bacteroidales bacterium]HOS71149.1 nicotinate phosphoribosyltransferase [Bacteroidales bacterium]HQH23242.1 nicotinate phosphoribosyltransferase [Bacteroidales bacterium]HQJ80900.1 nicotinate phosphoribosyltransferase [Bacteroidales bacterium]
MFNYTATYTDHYQLTMAQAYFLNGQKENISVFDYFFRKLPFNSGYAVFAGLENLLDILQELKFGRNDLEFLRSNGFHPEFLKYLEQFRFRGNIYSSREGDLVFPVRPVLQVEADIIEAQLVETILLNVLNFQTLVATKASRMRKAAGNDTLIDFGLRRAQGPGGYYASRAAYIGGFDATSNVLAGRDYGIPVSGTMAHSYIQSIDDELAAFNHFSDVHPDNSVLLVDTYDTLNSGIPNAIKTARRLEEKGHRLLGIRLDSGDLAYLAKKSRKMLDEAGLDYVKIAVSNQLDEYIIKSLKAQKAPIDVFGVGTSLVTGFPDAALDGVYKMAYSDGKPRIKISENVTKITLPHRKQVLRAFDSDGRCTGADVVVLNSEKDTDIMYHPLYPHKSFPLKNKKKEALLLKVMEGGKRTSESVSLKETAQYSSERLALLPDEYKRFDNPHAYKVGLSEKLMKERNRLIEDHKKY